ncbi:MAG: polyprenyl synthetase family protein [Bacilli bacterium]
MEEFKGILAGKVQEAEDSLENRFEHRFDAPDIIVSAMHYSLFAGGKRLRPILMRETMRALGKDPEIIAPLADAIEMIHTYSLIHDDLPAMDDDDTRRGKPTNHIVYGEDTAILAGDALLNFAMETALSGIPEQEPGNYIKAMQILFASSGVDGMIGGQVADTISDLSDMTPEKLMYIHEHKTGALLRAAVLCAAVAAGVDQEKLHALDSYAQSLGLAFQIVDDILDVEGDEKILGKPVGSDEKNHKATYVTLYGTASSEDRVQELKLNALAALHSIDGETLFLEDLAEYICNRDK